MADLRFRAPCGVDLDVLPIGIVVDGVGVIPRDAIAALVAQMVFHPGAPHAP